MQYVNDDMDELFRRAAENYPLDTNGADWNKVLAAMQGTEATKTVTEKKGNKKRRFLWLLLLLPMALIYNQLHSPEKALNEEAIRTVQKEEPANRSTQPIKTVPANDHSTTGLPGEKAQQKTNNKEQIATERSVPVPSDKNLSAQITPYSSGKKSSGNKNVPSSDLNRTAFSSDLNEKDRSSESKLSSSTGNGRTYIRSIFLDRQITEPVILVSRDLVPLNNPFEKGSKAQAARDKKRFYVGLVGAVDATTIKFQKVQDAGFVYGLLIGRELNKKWSIEAGYFVDKKYYYSEGKYFKTSRITMPPNSWIAEVSGNCKMIEVPVAVKYNFSSAKKSEWFATLGTSSYFMKKEKYAYDYYYGTAGPYPHYKEYNNSSTNLFSNISFSAGYAHQLGNTSYLRLEPYVKIPLSGMGIGDLPLFSAGLQLSISKKF